MWKFFGKNCTKLGKCSQLVLFVNHNKLGVLIETRLTMESLYFKHNKVDRNELQVRKSLHKGTGTKMAEKLNNLTEKK